ncbi:MAG: hypothetical protein JXB88_01095 [Spirochaetales bacterium]|nr:hypothetical protein [Spirochaetales bacterium]
MENKNVFRYKRFPGLCIMIVCCFFIPALFAGAADVSFHVSGRAYSVCVIEDEDGIEYESAPVPIPGPVIEIWDRETKILLGTGEGSIAGYYHVMYTAPEEPHTILIRVLHIVDGSPMLIGEMYEMPDESPILVNNRIFSLMIYAKSLDELRFSSTPLVSPSGQFMFVEVGNIDMDDIYDKEQDFSYSSKWGLTKDNDSAFGGVLELYGLFGLPTGTDDIPYYYRIHYHASDTGDDGYITDDLYKKNYTIIGLGVDVNRINMYKGTVTTPSGPLDNVYVCDEGLVRKDHYSPYWTEVGMRALWDTRGKTGEYTLSVEIWNKDGIPITPPVLNHYATLNLHLVNIPPICEIHTIEYLNNAVILGPGEECASIILLLNDGVSVNDNIQFNLTAWHDQGFVGKYELHVWHGHNTSDGDVFDISYSISDPPYQFGVSGATFVTPSSIHYMDCAYRFRLHIWPRITNGIDRHIYEREDNWYAGIDVIE